MKQNKTHPAIEAARKNMTQRYLISAAALIISAVLLGLGFLIKPKAKELTPEAFNDSIPVDTYSEIEITITSPMFSQDILDSSNKVVGERYYVLAVDTESNKFVLSVPVEYYKENLSQLETNIAKRLEDGKLEVLDENKKVSVLGYSREMSTNLKSQLNTSFPGYESQIYSNILEIAEKPETQPAINYFFIAAGCVGFLCICILITAFSLTAEYGRMKKKHENKGKSGENESE